GRTGGADPPRQRGPRRRRRGPAALPGAVAPRRGAPGGGLDRGVPGRRRQPAAPRSGAARSPRRLGRCGAGNGVRRSTAGAAADVRLLPGAGAAGPRLAPAPAGGRRWRPVRRERSDPRLGTGGARPAAVAGTPRSDRSVSERLRRWRLVLGGGDADGIGEVLAGEDAGRDNVLDALYGGAGSTESGGGDGATRPGRRGGGIGRSSPRVARWLGDIRRYFPAGVVSVLQRDAMERLGLAQLLLEPELLGAVQPDIHLVGTLLALRRAIPEHSRETARAVVRSVTDALEARLAAPTRQAVSGALHRAARTRRPRPGDIDW